MSKHPFNNALTIVFGLVFLLNYFLLFSPVETDSSYNSLCLLIIYRYNRLSFPSRKSIKNPKISTSANSLVLYYFILLFTIVDISISGMFVEWRNERCWLVILQVCYYSFSSIVNNGDAIGSVIILSTEIPITDSEEKMAIILSRILSKHFID